MSPPDVARRLFTPIGGGYERWAAVLSLGQDSRWRKAMVAGLGVAPEAAVLDVAAGTGSITRELERLGHRVTPLDQSLDMLGRLRGGASRPVAATAERLPFPDDSFDGLTFGYLLRYVDDVPACLSELTRVVRPGGRVGMVEFGRPTGIWGPLWRLYTRLVLPAAGLVIGSGWHQVGRFLGGSIDEFARRWPLADLAAAWEEAGLTDVEWRKMSLGGGVVMWGRKR